MEANVLWYGVVREFEATFLSVYTDLFLRATNALKPLKPACTIPCVCAQHKLKHTHLKALNKIQKYKFLFKILRFFLGVLT